MRFTMRVVLPHLGQSVLLLVSITFLRSAVLAIFPPTAIIRLSWSLQGVRSAPLNFLRGYCGWECSRKLGKPESTLEDVASGFSSVLVYFTARSYELSWPPLTPFPRPCYRHMFAFHGD